MTMYIMIKIKLLVSERGPTGVVGIEGVFLIEQYSRV